jgi:hypothetical protein
MRILWDITGPSKRQRIFTRYSQREASQLGVRGIDAGDAL